MKTFFLKILLIAILAWGMQYVSVWFAGPLMALGVNLFWKGSSTQGFFTGFLGLGLLWFALSLYADLSTGGLLTGKMGLILFQSDSTAIVILVTSLIGAIAGGLCGWVGAMARKLKN